MAELRSQRFTERQYMLKKDFEAFYYSDGSMRDVALHHHDFYEIYLFFSGGVRFTVESLQYELTPGDILLISPQELHQPVFSRDDPMPYARIVIWISAQTMRQTGSAYSCDLGRCFDVRSPGHTNLLRLDASERKPVFELASGLIRHDGIPDQYSGLLCAAQLTELLVLLNRFVSGGRKPPAPGDFPPRMLQDVAGFINSNLSERLTLERIAERHYISKYHLAHLFKREMGTTVYRYVTQKRLILAKQLLQENIPLKLIYKRCGFETYSSFYRAFRAEYGISPRDYGRSAPLAPKPRPGPRIIPEPI